MRVFICTIVLLFLAGNIGLSQVSRKNTQSEKSVRKVKSIAADKHVTVNQSNRQWKTNTTMGMFRGRPEKTNRHNYFGNQNQAEGDGVDTSQDNSEGQQPKKKKLFWDKFKFLQEE